MKDVQQVIGRQDEYVANTEESFHEVNDGIQKSIDGIRTIAEKTEQLDQARVKVVDVVQNLTAIAEENAAGTEETSASAAEVGNTMTQMADEDVYKRQLFRSTYIGYDETGRAKCCLGSAYVSCVCRS